MGKIARNRDVPVVDDPTSGRAQAGNELSVAIRLGVVLAPGIQRAGTQWNAQDAVGPFHAGPRRYAGENIGTGGPPSSVDLKFTRTAWPIRRASRSQSTMLVIIVGPSASVT